MPAILVLITHTEVNEIIGNQVQILSRHRCCKLRVYVLNFRKPLF